MGVNDLVFSQEQLLENSTSERNANGNFETGRNRWRILGSQKVAQTACFWRNPQDLQQNSLQGCSGLRGWKKVPSLRVHLKPARWNRLKRNSFFKVSCSKCNLVTITTSRNSDLVDLENPTICWTRQQSYFPERKKALNSKTNQLPPCESKRDDHLQMENQ